MQNKNRPLNEFVHCKCDTIYISGYLYCPVCGLKNPNDIQDDTMVRKHIEDKFDAIVADLSNEK